jgi:hypothetical protein
MECSILKQDLRELSIVRHYKELQEEINLLLLPG